MPNLKPYLDPTLIEAGVDEVGRGCLAGPVVAAAVILPKDYTHPLLDDSKKLSMKSMKIIEKDIKQNAIAFAISKADHKVIDEINILQASFLAMHKALRKLKTRPEAILVDGNRFKAFSKIPHSCHVKGDSKFSSIAAASVLAKVYRDEYMARLHKKFPVYGWERNVGYPTLEHRAAIAETGSSPYHRMSFKLLAEET
jgi:ribonuclease HII